MSGLVAECFEHDQCRPSKQDWLDRVSELEPVFARLADDLYIALARSLGCPLLTCDRALARAPGLGITVTVIEG